MSDRYLIRIVRAAEKELRRLSPEIRNRLIERIDALAGDPRPAGCRKLVATENVWRIRLGDYRVLHEIDDDEKVVRILAARHRGDAYS